MKNKEDFIFTEKVDINEILKLTSMNEILDYINLYDINLNDLVFEIQIKYHNHPNIIFFLNEVIRSQIYLFEYRDTNEYL